MPAEYKRTAPRTMNTRPSLWLVLAACALLGRPVHASEPADPAAHYVGMNVWFLSDWDGSNAFANIMEHARAWQKRNWSDGMATVDSEGWPLEDASTVIFGRDNQLGTYRLLFEGQASSVTLMWTAGSVTNLQYHAGSNTSTANVTLTNNNTGGLTFTGTRRQPGDPSGSGFRNVRLFRPGHADDGSEVFAQRFLALMQGFQVVRFMDWVDANKNGVVTWSQRQRPGMAKRPDFSYAGQSGLTYGLPIEYMVQLCNRIGADMWLNIPTHADDDYVTRTAQLVLYGSDGVNPYTSPQANPVFPPLAPGLIVHLEYANEVWNSAPGFRCFPWVLAVADAIAADPAPHPVKLNPSTGAYTETDRYTLQSRYTAFRSVQISQLFRAVFGDAAMNTRIRVALMGQIGGNYFNPRQLPWLEAFYSRPRDATDPFPNPSPVPVSHHLYAAGGSAYYGVNSWASASPDDYFSPGNYPETDWWRKVGIDALRARNYGLKRYAYEGGQGLDLFGRSGNPSASTEEKRALNGDPRMQDMTEVYHDVWTASGGDLLVYYVNTSAVDWEFTPSVNQLDTPKLRAAQAIMHTRPRVPVTLGQEIPGTLVARDQPLMDVVGSLFSFNAGTGEPTYGGWDLNEAGAFAINTRAPGTYRVRARAGTNRATTIQYHLNGATVGSVSFSGTSNTTLIYSPWLEIPVTEEFNAIRITTTQGGMHFHSLEFEFLGGLAISTVSPLPTVAQGAPYSTALNAIGGTQPYSWSVSSGALPPGLSLGPSTGVLSGTPTTAGAYTFTATVSDAANPPGSHARAFTLQVTSPPPSPPVIAEGAAISVVMSEDGIPIPFILTLHASSPGGGTLNWTIASSPSNGSASVLGLGDGSSATISFLPTPDWHGVDSFEVRVSDGLGGFDQIAVSVVVQPVNDAPVVANPIPAQAAIRGQAFTFTFAPDTFSDVDDPVLNYSAALADGAPLPAWLSFDPPTRTFSGTPGVSHGGELSLRVTATDSGGLTAQDTFTLAILQMSVLDLLANDFESVAVASYAGNSGTAFGADPVLGNASGAASAPVAATTGVGGSRSIANSSDPALRSRSTFDIRQGVFSYSVFFKYQPLNPTHEGGFIGLGWALPSGTDGVNTWSSGSADRLLVGLRRHAHATETVRIDALAALSSSAAIAGQSGDILTAQLTVGNWYQVRFDIAFNHDPVTPPNSTITVRDFEVFDRGSDGLGGGVVVLRLLQATFNHAQGANLDTQHSAYAFVVGNRDRGCMALDQVLVSSRIATPTAAFAAPPVSVTIAGSSLQLTFTRVSADLTYAVQSSVDLENWTTLATNPGIPGQPVTFSDPLPLSLGQPRFLRVAVTE